MKKIILLIIALSFSNLLVAQLILTNQNNGIIAVEYGENNDYSLYDPQGDNEIYLYLWVNETQTNPNLSQQYNDDWNDNTGLIVLNYDSNNQKFTGTIDFNTHYFSGEGVLPANTQINDFNLILRNQAGDRQSSDLLASDYGFQPTQVVNLIEIKNKNAVYYQDGNLIIHQNYVKKNMKIEIFDINGKLIQRIYTGKNIVPINKINSRFIIIRIISGDKFIVKKLIL